MNEKRAAAAGIKYSVYTKAFKDNDRSLAEGDNIGKIKMLLDEKERSIGVQILGPRAGDLVSKWVAALNGGVRLYRNFMEKDVRKITNTKDSGEVTEGENDISSIYQDITVFLQLV